MLFFFYLHVMAVCEGDLNCDGLVDENDAALLSDCCAVTNAYFSSLSGLNISIAD
jgi:hypothetical protein